jgi:energy-coupling factor transport system permease protein
MMTLFDPRARVIFYACFTSAVLITQDMRVLAGIALAGLLILIAARLPWPRVQRVVIGTVIFVAVTSGLNLIFRTPVEAAQQALRAIAMASSALALVLTFDTSQLGITFRKLGFPDRFAFLLDLMMRFVPTLVQDFRITVDAQKARGYELESKDRSLRAMLGAARRFVPLMVPVFVRSVLDAEDRANAMDMRAFGVGRRSWLLDLRYRSRDLVVIALALLGLAATIAWRFFG